MVMPQVDEMVVSNGQVTLSVTHLTPGTSNWVERSFDLRSNDWIRLPGFWCFGGGTNWAEAISSEWDNVFYRWGHSVE